MSNMMSNVRLDLISQDPVIPLLSCGCGHAMVKGAVLT